MTTDATVAFTQGITEVVNQIHSATNVREIILELTPRIVQLLECERLTIFAIDQEDLFPAARDDEIPLSVAPVFFGFDSSALDAENRSILEANARWFSQPENVHVRFVLEGHCDERGTDEYNLALADKRSQVVRQFLVDAGIDPGRMSTIALGEERPFDTGQSEESWALNRRVHFVLIQEQE